MPSSRLVFTAVFLACAALLGFGYYLQYGQGLEPCPMCVFQRIAFMVVAAVALAGALHGPGATGTRFYAALAGVAALVGGAIAARQTWLQHLPEDQVPECGPGLDFMLEMYPFWDVVAQALKGTGECAEEGWVFLGLSIAEWSLAWFVLFSLTALLLVVRPSATDTA